MKNRGVQDILIICVDNLTDSLKPSRPVMKTGIQKCIIYQIRICTRSISYKDLKKVTDDLNPICKSTTEERRFDRRPKEIIPAFQKLNVIKHLNGAGFKKKFGFTSAYLFRLLFVLLFHQKNWERIPLPFLESLAAKV